MSRPKITESEKKRKLSITISNEANTILDKLTINKSKFIDQLVINYYDENYGK